MNEIINRNFKFEQRNCECCGSNDFEDLWKNEQIVKTKNYFWHFKMNNVICNNCGFVFISPVPIANDLTEYYTDCYSYYSLNTISYSIENRISFIKRNITSNNCFVEIGCNQETLFHEQLKKIFSKIITVELNNEVVSDYNSVNDLKNIKANMVALYFVLEHVPKIDEFLSKCYTLLDDDGILIVEVPDIRIYPDDLGAQFLAEHVNHFSFRSMNSFAQKAGFKVIDSSIYLCSRPFGFVAAYKKESVSKQVIPSQDLLEVSQNKMFFNQGLKKYQILESLLDNAYERAKSYNDSGRKVVLWGANQLMADFFARRKPLNNFIIVDSDPNKKHFFEDLIVNLPSEVGDSIIDSDLIIFFTLKLYVNEILNSIKTSFSKVFDEKDIIFFD